MDVVILDTLFERGRRPAKRSQPGARYVDRTDRTGPHRTAPGASLNALNAKALSQRVLTHPTTPATFGSSSPTPNSTRPFPPAAAGSTTYRRCATTNCFSACWR